MRFLLMLLGGAEAQEYFSGVGKTTHLVSDAPAALSWLLQHMPSSHDTDGLQCTVQPGTFNESFCPCGQAGRVELECPECPDWQLGFGVHTISYNSSAPHIVKPTPRPIGKTGIATIERHVTRKLQAAAASSGYDALLDFSTGLWVSSLDPFVREFADATQFNTLPLEWRDELNGKTYFSLIVQVANRSFSSYVLIELMSANQTLFPPVHYHAPLPRFLFGKGQDPTSVFPPPRATATGKPIPTPVRISHFSSDVARDAIYYRSVLGRDASTVLSAGGVRTLVVDFEDMTYVPNYVQLHLVQVLPQSEAGQHGETFQSALIPHQSPSASPPPIHPQSRTIHLPTR